MIQLLGNGELPSMDSSIQKRLFGDFQLAQRFAEVASIFVHIKENVGGRFPLTGVGEANLYALFAETAFNLRAQTGRSGLLIPTGIATDKTTSLFFNHLVKNKQIASMFDFNNRYKLFSSVHPDTRFSCFTIAPSESIEVAFYMTAEKQLQDDRIRAIMSIEDFSRMNPNTGTCPLFRCEADAALAVKLYRKAPILINHNTGENPWGISFCRLLDMSNDSNLFLAEKPEGEDVLPLYEGKIIYNYDHRYNTFDETGNDAIERSVTLQEKKNHSYDFSPRYWVRDLEVKSRLAGGKACWFLGFRDITNPTNERTLIMSFFPYSAVGNKLPLIFSEEKIELQCCLLGNGNAIIFDYLVRLKVSGKNMNFFLVEQFPFLPPSAYTEADIAYISSRVLELSYTSYSMRPLAEALGYTGEPFPWDEDRRAQLKAELDAYYAKLYGLTREELAYILDPTTKYPTDCPTVTFPTLQNNEMKKYGEYRTQRLVLAAFDELTRQGK